ncbi:sugar phosphate isomerase/epimerase family protein [Novosphingobium aquimarinum]|uniref:sugar phosphate isomerase/epimerase family protein n=1 Tax=Novosphingobium aquimarinum TaxID=2682494 RepID=UPI0012EC132C|nr:sugar phosphate isomerase/epimerase family protein [Novosphingobium aquimarinum]
MRLRFAGHLGLRDPLRPLFAELAGSDDPTAQIAWLGEHGFAGVFDNGLSARPEAEQIAIGEAARRHGLAFGSIALDPVGWATPLWSRTDAASRERQREVVEFALEAAARVGGRTISCVTGLVSDEPAGAQCDAMADNLARVAHLASEKGVMLCVEPVAPDFIPGLLVRRLDEALTIVERASHPAIRVAYDVGHIAMTGDDPVAGIGKASALIGLVQIADAPGRADPGAGTIDWTALFAALEATGYTGLIEVETLPMEPGREGEAALLARLQDLDTRTEGE